MMSTALGNFGKKYGAQAVELVQSYQTTDFDRLPE
jgi:hypothetical protein